MLSAATKPVMRNATSKIPIIVSRARSERIVGSSPMTTVSPAGSGAAVRGIRSRIPVPASRLSPTGRQVSAISAVLTSTVPQVSVKAVEVVKKVSTCSKASSLALGKSVARSVLRKTVTQPRPFSFGVSKGKKPASVKPVEPVKLEPVKPVKPAESVKPVEPVKPVKPVKPIKPAEPVKPVEPVEEAACESLLAYDADFEAWKAAVDTDDNDAPLVIPAELQVYLEPSLLAPCAEYEAWKASSDADSAILDAAALAEVALAILKDGFCRRPLAIRPGNKSVFSGGLIAQSSCAMRGGVVYDGQDSASSCLQGRGIARHSDMSRCLLFSFEGSGEGMLGIRLKTVEELLDRHCGREFLPDTRQARRSLALLYRLASAICVIDY
ncbi:hypothetical protein E5Q_02648 [Mixia osmundae IAM 14324]|uniref:Uncharacterized protein n=1 Tax=Mixia osmundae (strain CBS 9802 / IAM 14324 / JCM 22182 / KY 12970) TaxID=764103 RepID=G7DZI0_MIXOS|nr:hypothetical protein E5Q_02648 [Mixia osmundae IAM 14324]